MDVNNRILELRKNLHLSRDAFGAKIGVSGHVVRNWDRNETNAADKPLILNIICKEYGVNREWLENGTGEMFDESSPSVVDMLVEKYNLSDTAKKVLDVYVNLDDSDKDAIDRFVQKIVDANSSTKNATSISSAMQQYDMTQREIIVSIKKSRYLTSAGIGYDLNDSDAWERVNVMDCSAARRSDFIVEIDGDSMEPTYCNGENVFVKATPDVEIGKIGIFIVDGKGYIKERGIDCLISHNKNYHPIMLEGTENRCVGAVLGVADVVED